MNVITSPAATFNIDPAHSSVEFVVRHLVISKVRGRFAGVSGSILIPDASDVPAAVDVTIAAATIDTREEERDGHLKSGDFLDVANFPALTFRSSDTAGSADDFAINGDLTLHGVTRRVSLRAHFDGRTTDPWGKDRIAFSAEAEIDRRDFGMVWNQALEAGGVLVGQQVVIEISVQAVKA
jgi:polyisoprenoid-binding protein YceI